jgi:hypothetical protein
MLVFQHQQDVFLSTKIILAAAELAFPKEYLSQ